MVLFELQINAQRLKRKIPIEILENIFISLCLENEVMHGALALVFKNWRKIVDNESFCGKVQRRFLDREFSVKDWSEQTKSEFYYSGIVIIKCLQCGKVFKDTHGYYRDPKSKATAYYPPTDLVDNFYCKDCAHISNYQDFQRENSDKYSD